MLVKPLSIGLIKPFSRELVEQQQILSNLLVRQLILNFASFLYTDRSETPIFHLHVRISISSLCTDAINTSVHIRMLLLYWAGGTRRYNLRHLYIWHQNILMHWIKPSTSLVFTRTHSAIYRSSRPPSHCWRAWAAPPCGLCACAERGWARGPWGGWWRWRRSGCPTLGCWILLEERPCGIWRSRRSSCSRQG